MSKEWRSKVIKREENIHRFSYAELKLDVTKYRSELICMNNMGRSICCMQKYRDGISERRFDCTSS